MVTLCGFGISSDTEVLCSGVHHVPQNIHNMQYMIFKRKKRNIKKSTYAAYSYDLNILHILKYVQHAHDDHAKYVEDAL
jgi:hypothetical protein